MTADSKIVLLSALVDAGRKDRYAIRNPNGTYRPMYFDGKVSAMLDRHLSSEAPVGVYLVTGTECRIGAIDLDDHDGDTDAERIVAAVVSLSTALIERGMRPLVFRSGGGRGFHIFILFRSSQQAKAVRSFLKSVIGDCGFRSGTDGVASGAVEIFPKQDSVGTEGLGNLIALPLARKSVPIDLETMTHIPREAYRPPEEDALFSPDLLSCPIAAEEPERHVELVLDGDLEEAAAALRHVASNDYNVWINVAFALKNCFKDQGYEVWREWSAKSEKFAGDAKCRTIWDGLQPRTTIGLGTIFYLGQQNGWNGPSDPVIREMNARFGILTTSNKTLIVVKNRDWRQDDELNTLTVQPFYDRLRAEVFAFMLPNSTTNVEKAPYWFKHPKAARYDRLDFDPSSPPGHNGKTWNAWQGFAYKPRPGSWSLLQDHLLVNVCGGDEEKFAWLLNWLAFGLQRPGEVPGTALVLLGAPGVGKSFVANAFGALWRPHYTTITHEAHVTGRFNSFLFAKRVVFIDEGTFGGDRKSAGVLKARVTEPYIMLERKGIDPIKLRNRAMYIIASNEELVVPADLGDRRWMIMRVGERNREDHRYFAEIQQELEQGGYEAMMFDLLKRDLNAGPNPQKIIRTSELFEQILQAQPPQFRYFHGLLEAGQLPGSQSVTPNVTTIGALFEDYRRINSGDRFMTEARFGKCLASLFPGTRGKQNGRYRVKGTDGVVQSRRSTEYVFPPLREARRMFERSASGPIAWGELDIEWEHVDVSSDLPI